MKLHRPGIILILLLVFSVSLHSQEKRLTPFEQSKGKETGTYDEVISFYQSLAQASENIRMIEMGTTDVGQPLHLIIVDHDQDFDFSVSREKGKKILLINNGIHPGEPDGIESSMMLARDLAQGDEEYADIVVAIIPIYNVGGALNRNQFSRANQNGPREYGFRGNARNYDLNRDFVKSDTKNARSFYRIFHKVRPHLFIDTHVSNGADYQYNITHLATQHNKLGGPLGEFLEQTFTPALEEAMAAHEEPITPYVNVFNRTPDPEGFSQFIDYPRYSTGYTTLFHTLGFMIETHMLKPFEKRVQATSQFLWSSMDLLNQFGDPINTRMKLQEEQYNASSDHAIDWSVRRDTSTTITFLGYEGKIQESAVTGLDRLKYDRSKPFSREIPYYNIFEVSRRVTVPSAYIIPQGWHSVIDRLQENEIQYQQLKEDRELVVERYEIMDVESLESPYEGHFRHTHLTTAVIRDTILFFKGDYLFPTDQWGGRFLVETLEPEAPDSYFRWNFFDMILQRKEGFSPYVFEDVAEDLLKNDPALRTAFEKQKKENPGFAESAFQQLGFIYKHSEYFEKAFSRYPVYRLIE